MAVIHGPQYRSELRQGPGGRRGGGRASGLTERRWLVTLREVGSATVGA